PKLPLLLANAVKLWPSSRKPAATRPSARHGSMESAATCARNSGVIAAVDSLKVGLGRYSCGPIAGMNSGFSGASRARSSARRTTRSSASSLNSLMVAVPTRLPNATCTPSSALPTSPLVETLLRAKRMLPSSEPLRVAVHSSACDRPTTFWRISRACSSVKMVMLVGSPWCRSAERAGGIDDVDAVEAGGGRAVRHGRNLRGLALAVEERATQAIVGFVADRAAGVPELRRADLVSHVLDHAGDLAVLDLVEQLAAELGVVALLVDRERAVADDVDAVLDVLDHVFDGQLLTAGGHRDVGHALELHRRPGVGVAAAVGLLLAQDVGLVADGLVIDQDAVADQVPALGLHALVVVRHRAQAARLGLVGEDRHQFAAVLETFLALVERGEAGAGVVGLVAEHAVELQRMADGLVDGEPGVRGIEHQVVAARLHRRRGELLARLLGRGH